VAVFPADSADKDTVLKQAGVAMRHAQQAGRGGSGGLQFYSQQLNAESLHRLGLERELHRALERQEFTLHYQPQVGITSGRLCGAEALVRWLHPQRGLLAPAHFITVAEEAGLIGVLGDWVLRESLRQWAAWRREGLVLQQMAVNVSSLQLQNPGLCADVQEALRAAGAEASTLCLELTESAIIGSGPQVGETLAALKALGVKLALDDFGTGYSSLTYLRRFPIDEIKIDRSFVTDCDSDGHNAAITAAIIAMAHGLGLRVVAEGVETPRQLAVLRTHGADAFQGYLYARPLPAAEFAALLGVPQREVACV
jgi:EAL domain-containing protein (putative c-di-GMP-specific phosphodiesterase class I)